MTFFFAGLFMNTLKLNTELGEENYEIEKDNSNFQTLIEASTRELQECKKTRNEYQQYFSVYELEQRKEFYNQPAIDWEETGDEIDWLEIVDEDEL